MRSGLGEGPPQEDQEDGLPRSVLAALFLRPQNNERHAPLPWSLSRAARVPVSVSSRKLAVFCNMYTGSVKAVGFFFRVSSQPPVPTLHSDF